MLTPADTAFAMAIVRADEALRPAGERLFEDPYAALFAARGGHADEGTQRFLSLPFFRDAIRLRTRYVDDALRDGLAAGLTQVVLLGAGFDTRGLRMGEIVERRAAVFEVDTPDQLARKREALVAAGVTSATAIAYVPFDFDAPDLETALPAALAAHGFDDHAGALFVWEGVIGYIALAAVEGTLRLVARACGSGGRLVFTYGEGAFAASTAVAAAAAAGFEACDEESLEDLWRRYVAGAAPPGLAIAKVATARRGAEKI
jgi:methyltransferase (TIGR00027 family)